MGGLLTILTGLAIGIGTAMWEERSAKKRKTSAPVEGSTWVLIDGEWIEVIDAEIIEPHKH